MKLVMEASLNDYIDQVKSLLPEEPKFDSTDHINIIFTHDKDQYARRFNPTDKISVFQKNNFFRI
jgi:hypothetical protein